jgi:F-type H+-transporting ATPase subunit delta
MKISKVAAASARRLFGLCQTDDRLDDAKLRTVFQKVATAKPRDFRAILAALHRLTRLDVERRTVTVESAAELPQPDQRRVMANLITQYGDNLIFNFTITPGLLGGLRIRVGNDLYDGSVQGRIDRLAAAFK